MATASDSTNPEFSQSETSPPKNSPHPWAFDEDDTRIYHDDGDVQPTIAYIERDGVAPEQVKADGYLLASPLDLLEPLKRMLEVADARNCDPKKRTLNLKFSRLTLKMWQEQARAAIA